MQDISENILNEINNCATERSLELFRSFINLLVTDYDLRLSCIGAIGARYFDIYYFERISMIYYPEFSLN